MVYHANGQVGKRQSSALGIQGYAINEITYRGAVHTVDTQIEVGTNTTLLTNLHTGRAVYDVIE